MVSMLVMLLAGVFLALSNYLMRKSIDQGGTAKGFLVIQLATVFGVAIFLNPVRMGSYSIQLPTVGIGVMGGFILAFMMFLLAKALEIGPAGLTFAVLNSATVFPAFLLAAVLGASYGYLVTPAHLLGSLFVLIGLFWAGWTVDRGEKMHKWLWLITGMFILHICFMVLLSLRAFCLHHSSLFLLPHFPEMSFQSFWFMPIVFIVAALIQAGMFFSSEKRRLRKSEAFFGMLGGLANGVGTFLMIYSTEIAKGSEQMILYPLLSITVIFLCNIWGQILYHEKINWMATALSLTGIMVAGIF